MPRKIETIFSAALILGAASFISRVVGVIRSRIFADQFGAGETLDIYFAAFKIPDLMYNLLVLGALSAGFIPVFMKLYVRRKEDAWRLTNGLMSMLGLVLIVLSAILFLLMPILVPYLVPGFDVDAQQMTVYLSRIMLGSTLLLGISTIVSGVLQSVRCLFAYAIAPILYNIGIIIGALFFVPVFGTPGLAYGVLFGAALHLLIQLPSLWKQGFRLNLFWPWYDREVKEVTRLMLPRTLAIATHQLNFVVMTMIASTLAVGSITVFTFANDLQYFAVGIIGVSFAMAAFPVLSELEVTEKYDDMRVHLMKTIRQVLLCIIPVTILFLLLRAQIVRVVLGSGKFDWTATIATADTLALFAISLFAQSLIPLLSRTFYTLHNTKTPLVIAVISALLTIALSLVLKDSLGVAGLALAFSIGNIVQCALLWITLRKEIKHLQELTLLQLLYKISIGAILMAVVTQWVKTLLGESDFIDMTRFWGILTQGAGAGFVGIAIFILAMYLLHVEEIRRLFSSTSTAGPNKAQ